MSVCVSQTLMSALDELEPAAECMESVMDSVHLVHTPVPVIKVTYSTLRKMTASVRLIMSVIT